MPDYCLITAKEWNPRSETQPCNMNIYIYIYIYTYVYSYVYKISIIDFEHIS